MQVQLVIITANCRTQQISTESITAETESTSMFYKNIETNALYPKNSLGGVYIENGCLQIIVQESLVQDSKDILNTLFGEEFGVPSLR